jgi:hypothetical protein
MSGKLILTSTESQKIKSPTRELVIFWLPGTDSLHFLQGKLTVVGRRRS